MFRLLILSWVSLRRGGVMQLRTFLYAASNHSSSILCIQVLLLIFFCLWVILVIARLVITSVRIINSFFIDQSFIISFVKYLCLRLGSIFSILKRRAVHHHLHVITIWIIYISVQTLSNSQITSIVFVLKLFHFPVSLSFLVYPSVIIYFWFYCWLNIVKLFGNFPILKSLLIGATSIKSISWIMLLINWLFISSLPTIIISFSQWHSVSFEWFLVHERVFRLWSASTSFILGHSGWDCHWYTTLCELAHSLVFIRVSILEWGLPVISILIALIIYVVVIVRWLIWILISFVFLQNTLDIHSVSLCFSLLFQVHLMVINFSFLSHILILVWISLLIKSLLILSILILSKFICYQYCFVLLSSLWLLLTDCLRKISVSTHVPFGISIHFTLSWWSRVWHRYILISRISISNRRIFWCPFCICKTAERFICSAKFLICSHLIHISCICWIK